MKLRITCKTGEYAEIDDLCQFQGDLKSLSDDNFNKLKKSFIKHGFTAPIFVWFKSGRANILDGHQRVKTLKRLRDVEGWNIPPLPVVPISAKDASEAKRKVLQFCSDFGTMERDGLYEFVSTVGIEMDELLNDFSLRQIDLDSFKLEFFEEPDGGATHGDDKADSDTLCPSCGNPL